MINSLHIIAMIAMLIDHSAFMVSGEMNILFHVVGRLAFPFYLYFLVEGAKKTKNVNEYFSRLLFIALISELPFYYLFDRYCNVVWVLLYCLMLLELSEKTKLKWHLPLLINCIFIFLSGYWFYAGLVVYGLSQDKKVEGFFIVLLSLFLWDFSMNYVCYQAFGILIYPLIYFYQFKVHFPVVVRKYFYPVHMIFLFIIKYSI